MRRAYGLLALALVALACGRPADRPTVVQRAVGEPSATTRSDPAPTSPSPSPATPTLTRHLIVADEPIEPNPIATPNPSPTPSSEPSESPEVLPYRRDGAAGSVGGRVTDPDGQPIAGICAQLWNEQRTQVPAGEFGDFLTDGSGRYEISVAPAVVYLYIDASCGPGARRNTSSWFRDDDGPIALDVRSAGARSADLVLEPKGKIAGYVTGALGIPLAGVCVLSNEKEGNTLTVERERAEAITDLTGYYEYPVDAGVYDAGFFPCEAPAVLGTYEAEYHHDVAPEDEAAATWIYVRSGETTRVDAQLTQTAPPVP